MIIWLTLHLYREIMDLRGNQRDHRKAAEAREADFQKADEQLKQHHHASCPPSARKTPQSAARRPVSYPHLCSSDADLGYFPPVQNLFFIIQSVEEKIQSFSKKENHI